MRIFKIFAGLSMVALTLAGRPAYAVDPLFDPPPPVVHILLDTSGSMQYDSQGSTNEDYWDLADDAVPVCSPDPGVSGKSRYIVATEVLCGTLQDYLCEYESRGIGSSHCPNADCYWSVPHVKAHGTRMNDGLLDRVGASFKFGVMTMDSNPLPFTNSSGGYSYGPEWLIDLGAQNENSPIGRLVPPSASDDPADITTTNARVRQSILDARPWSVTVLGPMLYDAEYLIRNHPVHTADPYDACREKHIILITDGRNNTGLDIFTYLDPVAQANRLRRLGFEVWVVGFNMAPGYSEELWEIATYNGALPDDHLLYATDGIDLANALRQIFSNVARSTQSRTRPVVTQNTGNYTDVQYQFNAGYAVAMDATGGNYIPDVMQGILERSVYKCGVTSLVPGTAGLGSIQSIGDKLSSTGDGLRNIYTMVAGDLESFENGTSDITNEMLAAPNPAAGPVPDFGRDTVSGWCKSAHLSGTNEEKLAQWRLNLFNYVRATADSCRASYKLGAIYHSTPALHDNLRDVNLPIPSFTNYKQSISTRPGMLYVATHDGMLHAFRTDRPDARYEPDTWGKELWAYIPAHQLPYLKLLPEGRETLLDGSPVVADLILSRTATSRLTEDEDSWKSVLIFGDRGGGRGYSALDVTDPTNGNWSVLWEISAANGRCPGGSITCNPGGASEYENDFQKLGYTFGRPAIGTVMICPDMSGTCAQTRLEEVGVAVFGGGSSEGIAGAGIGRTLYVVRLDTGEKLAEFRTGNSDGDDSDVVSSCDYLQGNIDADIVGDITCISTMPGTFLTRCWVGDSAGRLWRVELGSPDRSEWRMSLLYDPYDFTGGAPAVNAAIRAPAYEAPAVSTTRGTNEPVVIYTGGDMDNLRTVNQASFVVSLTDSIVDVIPADCSPWLDNACWRQIDGGLYSGPKVNWKHFIGYDTSLHLVSGEVAGSRVMGAPQIYGGVTYFTSFHPSPGNLCIPGTGRLYGVDYMRNTGSCDSPYPKLSLASDPFNFQTYIDIGDEIRGALPYGVVVVDRPSCFGSSSIYDAGAGGASGNPLGTSGSGQPQLVVQTGVYTGEIGEQPAQGSTDRSINQIMRTIGQTMQSIVVGTWGAVFD